MSEKKNDSSEKRGNLISITGKHLSRNGEWLVIRIADNAILLKVSELKELFSRREKESKQKGA
ncbi:MAG: hypothetical protein H6626_05745 [Pseudobdellovibrionaceae bacterium]|nr:hypothetical protein [Bdellovibrionales bacterium]USN48597.1 MAG: hypothetical protein H6626_05745 [Pseudobdellovibrionaceae bacterium]